MTCTFMAKFAAPTVQVDMMGNPLCDPCRLSHCHCVARLQKSTCCWLLHEAMPDCPDCGIVSSCKLTLYQASSLMCLASSALSVSSIMWHSQQPTASHSALAVRRQAVPAANHMQQLTRHLHHHEPRSVEQTLQSHGAMPHPGASLSEPRSQGTSHQGLSHPGLSHPGLSHPGLSHPGGSHRLASQQHRPAPQQLHTQLLPQPLPSYPTSSHANFNFMTSQSHSGTLWPAPTWTCPPGPRAAHTQSVLQACCELQRLVFGLMRPVASKLINRGPHLGKQVAQ